MKIVRWIFYLALTAAIIYGGYLVYMKWVSGQPISSLWQKAQEYASTTAGTVQTVSQTVNSAQATVQSVQSTVASATSAFDAVKNSVGGVLGGIGDALQSVGSVLTGSTTSVPSTPAVSPAAPAPVSISPSTPSSSSALPLPPATVTTPISVPLYFSLTSGSRYSIDWGDGTTSAGALNQGAPTVVRHAWNAAGNYVVKVTIDQSSYTFPISVYQS